jgi:ABC-type sugar transport system ATPase subunit
MSTGTTPHVEVVGLWKRYGGAAALRDVSLSIARGQIHAIVGENGAGKSTLGKIIAGATAPNDGEIRINGIPVSYRSPRDALAHGIALVHQEISLVPTLSVLENVFLGAETRRAGIIDDDPQRARLQELSAQTGFALPADAVVSTLPPAEQQKVEIVRALARDARVIIFDEPTAPLTLNESEALYAVLRKLRAQGTTIIFISHFLDEVLGLADTVTVLKDGRHVQTGRAADATVDSLIVAMLGRSLEATFPAKKRCAQDAPVILEVRDLRREGVVEPSSITVRAGEIVGLAGLVGSGRTELAQLIFGADHADGGTVHLDGEPLRARSPREAIKRGIAYVPESRKDQGMILTRSVRENVTLPSLGELSGGGFVRRRAERAMTERVIAKIDLRPPEPERPIATLSGGNQQKIVFGRWLMREPRVLIADEPTRGVDVGAKHALYELLLELAQRGTAVLFISSELEEITGLSHRIYVMRQGRVVAELDGDARDDRILAAAFRGNEGAGA